MLACFRPLCVPRFVHVWTFTVDLQTCLVWVGQPVVAADIVGRPEYCYCYPLRSLFTFGGAASPHAYPRAEPDACISSNGLTRKPPKH